MSIDPIVLALIESVPDGRRLYHNNAVFYNGVQAVAQVALYAASGLAEDAVKRQQEMDQAAEILRREKMNPERLREIFEGAVVEGPYVVTDVCMIPDCGCDGTPHP